MASFQSVLLDIRGAIEALPDLPTEFPGGDYADTLGSIPPSATVYQVQHQHEQEVIRSNQTYQVGAVEIFMHHHVFDSTGIRERFYTRGGMISDQAELLDRDWWTGASTGIYQLQPDSRPTISLDVVRVGNVISYSVLCLFEIVPS